MKYTLPDEDGISWLVYASAEDPLYAVVTKSKLPAKGIIFPNELVSHLMVDDPDWSMVQQTFDEQGDTARFREVVAVNELREVLTSGMDSSGGRDLPHTTSDSRGNDQ